MLLQKVIMKEAQEIPSDFKGELSHEKFWVNIRRERMLSYFLIVTVAILLCLDGFTSRFWTENVHIFVGFSYFHVMLLVISILFLFVFNNKMQIGIKWSHKNLLHIFYIWLVMLISSIIALITVSVDKQPYAYFIAMFSIASMVFLSRRERWLIYFVPYLVYVLGVVLSSIDPYDKIGKIFFTTLFVCIALFVSGNNYYSFTSNFIKNKIISEKNKELDSLNNIIADALEKRTEEFNKIVEYDKLRTTFFANISHELRTPLTVILSAHQMMTFILPGLGTIERKKDIDQYLRMIKQNCHRLIRLISNMIDITKIDSNYLSLNLRNLDIVRIMEDIVLL
jgi:signal transduction histidine kinase